MKMKAFHQEVVVSLAPADFTRRLKRAAEDNGLRLKVWGNAFSIHFPATFLVRRYASAHLNGKVAACGAGTRVVITSTVGPLLVVSMGLFWCFMLVPGLPIAASAMLGDGADLTDIFHFVMLAGAIVVGIPIMGAGFFFAERSALADKVKGLITLIEADELNTSASCRHTAEMHGRIDHARRFAEKHPH